MLAPQHCALNPKVGGSIYPAYPTFIMHKGTSCDESRGSFLIGPFAEGMSRLSENCPRLPSCPSRALGLRSWAR